jgi:acyl-CoA reductase-like NAD-dependent aldehyde dehydrogenase
MIPSMIPLWTIPMAATTGNTLILKPSERDPGAAMIIAELCQRAGESHALESPQNFDVVVVIPRPPSGSAKHCSWYSSYCECDL